MREDKRLPSRIRLSIRTDEFILFIASPLNQGRAKSESVPNVYVEKIEDLGTFHCLNILI